MKITGKWTERRKALGEVVGGGYFVFRRGKKTGRIASANLLPFEHATENAAYDEAYRLAKANPGEQFVVLGASTTVGPFLAPLVENVERMEAPNADHNA